MARTSHRSRGSRRSQSDTGTLDLFKQQLDAAVEHAFEGKQGGTEAASTGDGTPALPDPAPNAVPTPGNLADAPHPAVAVQPAPDLLPARMINEFVYCPRLFFYEHVEGIFVESADTVRGTHLHSRVDKGNGALPAPASEGSKAASGAEQPAQEEADVIHTRSVTLSSERLGVTAKLDLLEAEVGSQGVAKVCPVDYKAGSPKYTDDGRELWDTDKVQLGLQCLILRDNGYACDDGVIYYRGSKQRVPLQVTPELESWICEQIVAARQTALGTIPPPLVDSPKCVRCSLAPVCLPDETQLLALHPELATTPEPSPSQAAASEPRRLIAARDERRPLYLNTQGHRIGCAQGVLKVKEKDRVVQEVRANDVSHVALFGNIQVSTQAIQALCDHDIPVTFFSMGGWFYGLARGHSLKNVTTRIAQFRVAAEPAACLGLARQFIRGKIHNQRVMFMRNHISPNETVKLRLGQARQDALAASSAAELLGVEGAAAALYFQQFAGMLSGNSGPESEDGEAELKRFQFDGRNRRPPTDPVNALLSLAYSLLSKECVIAAYAVGLDPYVGFYHQPRHGRPALALDLMEEFRPLIAESAVITAINNRFVTIDDFVRAGKAVNLSADGRKHFFQCFEQRMNALITHPVFEYQVSYRRALELQFRILARVLTGEIPEYVPFVTR